MNIQGTYYIDSKGISGNRPILQSGILMRLLATVNNAQIPDQLARIFTLCASSHRLCACLTLDKHFTIDDQIRRMHHRQVWEEHLRFYIIHHQLHHWASWLNDKNYMQALTNAIQIDPQLWLQNWYDNGFDWAKHWAKKGTIHLINFDFPDTSLPTAFLTMDDLTLQTIRQHYLEIPNFAQYPTVNHQACINGSFTRAPIRAQTIQECVLARWAEFLRLSLGDEFLRYQTGIDSQGSWAALEMARGILLHQTRQNSTDSLLDYTVIAPTEWNLHPNGIVRNFLPPHHQTSSILWMLDPCCMVKIIQ